MMDILTRNAGTIGLLLFFIFFLVMLAWVFRPGSKRDYAKCANIPLKEDKND